jgi:hypothetical protein
MIFGQRLHMRNSPEPFSLQVESGCQNASVDRWAFTANNDDGT